MERVGYPCALIAVSAAVFLWLEQPARNWLRSSLQPEQPEICILRLDLAEEAAEPE